MQPDQQLSMQGTWPGVPELGFPAASTSSARAGAGVVASSGGPEAVATPLDDIDKIVKTYRARIIRFIVFSTGDPDLAETLAQECLLKAFRSRANFRGDASIGTWLTSIALNLVRDHQRTKKFKFWKQAKATAIDVSDVASFVAAEQSTPEAQLIAKEQVARLAGILDTLSLNQRTVFLMKFSEEMDLQEIAAAMNMPVNTIKTHLHRALKVVRTQLGAAPAAAGVKP
jgi:RNA polymerase sigma-70 factor (ECF subfamily)